jgi:hypothetical protein
MRMLSKIVIATFTILGISGFEFMNKAIAQVPPPPPLSQQSLQEFQQPAQSNFSFGNSNSGVNLLQLLQNANLLNGRSSEDVSAGQKETIEEASVQFRKQQRQQLGVTNPVLVDNPTPIK